MPAAGHAQQADTNANASALNLVGKSISTTTSAGCGVAELVWSMDVGAADAEIKSFPPTESPTGWRSATWVDAAGIRWVYSASAAGVDGSKVAGDEPAAVWKSRAMTAPARGLNAL